MNKVAPDLVSYVVQRVQEKEGELSKTKLVKLLYLIDVEHYRRFRKTLTDLTWYFYHYGPYAFELESVLRNMPFGFDEEEVVTAKGHQAYVYRSDASIDDLEIALDKAIGPVKRAIVDRVIDTWALNSLNSILDYAYYETEPMQDARRGEPLDFSKVEPHQPSLARRSKPLASPSETEALRRRFRELVASTKRSPRPRITPPPYDDVYYEALKLMDAEESSQAG